MSKKEKEENSEESDLEKEIEEEEEELDDEEFQEFIQQRDFFPLQEIEIEETSPSLIRQNIFQDIPVKLEQEVADSSPIKKDEENDFFYSSRVNQKDESKYQDNKDETFAPKRTEMENLGRTDFQQEVGFVNARENFESMNSEKYDTVKQQDISSLGKEENPFAKKEIKYEPSKNH